MRGLDGTRTILIAAASCGVAAAVWTLASHEPTPQERVWNSGSRGVHANELARAAETEEDWARAIELQTQWLKDVPRDAIGWYDLGRYFAALEWSDRAREAWLRAVEIQTELAEQNRRAVDWYRLARFQLVAGDSERAIGSLSRAADAGWSRADQTLHDPTLAAIRDDARFSAIIEKMRTNRSDGRTGV
jgi:tetratricopeptide (TPR) repeat protein